MRPRPRVNLRVAYCERGNYRPVAERLLGAVAEEFPRGSVKSVLEPASGGDFEVFVGGELVYSKRATHRLPEAAEIFYHLGAALSPGAGQGRRPAPTTR